MEWGRSQSSPTVECRFEDERHGECDKRHGAHGEVISDRGLHNDVSSAVADDADYTMLPAPATCSEFHVLLPLTA